MNSPHPPLLEALSLTKRFNAAKTLFRASSGVLAVDRVSLNVFPGETLAIVGESGSGKSTLGRLLLGLLPASEGEVWYQGRNICALKKKPLNQLRRELQIIFQDPFASLNPRMTVGEIIGEPIWLHENVGQEERRQRVRELLDTVGLPAVFEDRYPHEFSGGQRQRIGIARALACGPKLLLGDEPVSALDVSVQAQVINLLAKLKQQFGLTMIIVAHGLAVVRHMSDRTAVMYLGQIIESAPTGALFDSPLHPYTQALIRSAPGLAPGGQRDLPIETGELPGPGSVPRGCRYHTRCPHVRDVCRNWEPVLTPVGEGRQVSCHRWRELQQPGTIVAAPLSEAFLRRHKLFERQISINNSQS
ncbi:ABC transporter ATP-binding protein [Sodalis sp. RH15]|uniref:ABC transporter ATP-binding protein n=1 Tax=Sodalis sp. RH15 TaxID=3394330 RepID=UPI0039B3B3B3